MAIGKAGPGGARDAGVAMSEGQRAYEARRAAKAGMSLDRWLEQKRRADAAQEQARLQAAAEAVAPPKQPGFLSRLIDRAHKPLR